MTDFKSLEIYEFPHATEENLYWKNLGFPYVFKEFGGVDFIDFCTHEPYNAAVTCSAKVQIYSTTNNSLLYSLNRFKKTAYGGTFRNDGKLLIAGSDDGFLRLFELQSHKLLRIFKGHTGAIHRCNFTVDGVHVISFSDDKTVALWDIPTETRIKSFEEHGDYIRAGTVSQVSQDLILSGSYDHTAKMFDTRIGTCVISVDHGDPVESVLMLPGGLFISAGGTNIKVWDPVAGRLLCKVSHHHKTITSLCFASNGRHLMSGSLDKHVKIYDITSYEVVHSFNYSSPILSICSAPGDQVLAVGMTDGLLSIRHMKKESISEVEDEKRRHTFYQHRLYGTNFKFANVDVVVSEKKKNVLKKYEKCLKKFEFSRALDTVLKSNIQSKNPEIVISVFMELIRRGSIQAAMGGREGNSLLMLLKFVTKYIGDPRFMRVLIDVSFILIDIYGANLGNAETRKQFEYLFQSIKNIVVHMKVLIEVQGIIQSVLI